MTEKIITPEALDALPVGSVVRNHSRAVVAERLSVESGVAPGNATPFPWGDLWSAGSLITVLFRPDTPAPSAEDREAIIEAAFTTIGREEPLSSITRSDIAKWIDLLAPLLATRQPAPVDAETTTEWGVRYEVDGYVHRALNEASARRLVAAPWPRLRLVYREVGPWREVARG